jgi:hypothetical protein
VNKEKSVYLPREFLEKLVRNDLRPPLVLTGMAKKGEDDDKQVWFAIGTNCANWRVVPLNLVESIEALEIVPCRDHTHPLVKMYFKKPNSEDSMLFASLAINIIRAAGDAVVKVLAHVQASGPTVRSDCVQCLRDCRVQSPEDFFACLDRCARLCPPVAEPQFNEGKR